MAKKDEAAQAKKDEAAQAPSMSDMLKSQATANRNIAKTNAASVVAAITKQAK